ncbi:recombinase family protein [Streptomyces sp. NBC_01320]|uniref:recombinase family protein n=1 Tax=Streptomyces sp. NBC_01320 TaxID=2903824 RepID=UPI002E0E1E1C|nr:recombinase family protein [Streptomyces sp. NBC_01320]
MPQVDGIREALAACRADDTLVVTALDRLARSMARSSPRMPRCSMRCPVSASRTRCA